MATKAQKRAAGEAKAKREAEERRQSGLAAQRIGRAQDAVSYEAERAEVQRINKRHRAILATSYLQNGVAEVPLNELTVGDFLAVAHLYETVANRRLRDEQPPLNVSDYVGERERYDDYTKRGAVHEVVTMTEAFELSDPDFMQGVDIGQDAGTGLPHGSGR